MEIVELKGLRTSQMAKKYGVSRERVVIYAQEHNIPYVSNDGGRAVYYYVFDAEAEKAFANRPKESSGRKPGPPKPPKVPGKPGRPRKEKPVDTTPKRPVGRPRKNPKEGLDIVPKRAGRGRPRKVK